MSKSSSSSNGIKVSDSVASSQSSPYIVRACDWTDAESITNLKRCQAGFVADHCRMYAPVHPGISPEQWRRALSCGSLREYLRAGVIVLQAIEVGTGSTAGYISCSPIVPTPPRSNGYRTAKEAEADFAPYGKINHLMVMPSHRGRGVGRLLWNGLLQHLLVVAPKIAEDLRIVAVELNDRALEWYWRLGFRVIQLYTDFFHVGQKCHMVVYLKMRRRAENSGTSTAVGRFFAEEICGEKAIVLKSIVRHGSIKGPQAASSWRQWQLRKIRSFDDKAGKHTLEDGTAVDLTEAFAEGLVRFEKPLHTVLASSQYLLGEATHASSSPSGVCRRAEVMELEGGDVIGESMVAAPGGATSSASRPLPVRLKRPASALIEAVRKHRRTDKT